MLFKTIISLRQWHVQLTLMYAVVLSLKIPTREYLTDKKPGSLSYLCVPIIMFASLHPCNIMSAYTHNYVIRFASD